jgi:hypothetical protein
VLIALVVFTAFVFGVDYVFGELFRVLLDPGSTESTGAAAQLTAVTLR